MSYNTIRMYYRGRKWRPWLNLVSICTSKVHCIVKHIMLDVLMLTQFDLGKLILLFFK